MLFSVITLSISFYVLFFIFFSLFFFHRGNEKIDTCHSKEKIIYGCLKVLNDCKSIKSSSEKKLLSTVMHLVF